MSKNLHIQPLDPSRHDREGFDCGVPELNDYLARRANLDVKRSACRYWMAVASETGRKVLGFYTLSAEAVEIPK